MLDAMRSPASGRELVRVGRRGGRFSLLVAAGSGRRGEALALAVTGSAERSQGQRGPDVPDRDPDREIVASII